MNIKDNTKAVMVRAFLFCCICFSIWLMYYVNVVQKNYHIYTNPTGPDKSDS